MAHWLAAASRPGAGDLKEGDFWLRTAEKLLAPLLLAAAGGGGTMADVVAWLDRGPEEIDAEIADS